MSKPSEFVKSVGLDNLKQVADLIGKPEQTLINWHKHNFPLFEVVVYGAVIKNLGGFEPNARIMMAKLNSTTVKV